MCLSLAGATFDDPSPEEWLADTLSTGDVIGFDPTLMSVSKYPLLDRALPAIDPCTDDTTVCFHVRFGMVGTCDSGLRAP